ncbi:MAG: alpha-galactosidase, partial [Lachnospiraceae bacterium]|nr:alpha-galactosidase [Lachnospiraceae bacterium]
MPVFIDETRRLFTIHTKHTTYQMTVGKYGHLLHLYYGKKLAFHDAPGSCDSGAEASENAPDLRYLLTFYDRGFSGNPYDAGTDRTYSMDALPQEYPCFGTGDYRSTALQIRNADGTASCDLRYKSARVLDEKYSIPGMPAIYSADPCEAAAETNAKEHCCTDCQEADQEGQQVPEPMSAQTLEIVLEDKVSGVEVTLLYGVLSDSDVITRAARIRNTGADTVYVEKAASCCLDFLYGEFDLIHFHGRHGMERQFSRTPLSHAEQILQSRRGASSHQQNPFFILASKDAGETNGDCYGFQLLYSGNFKGEASVDQYKQTRALLGISDELFSWKLMPGETFDTPEAALCCSDAGFGALSEEYHRLIRRHVCRGYWRDRRRPVLINSWEAAYFDFDADKLVRIAKQASELGVEMLVLDDGWFGKRDSDNSGLGDWYV